MKKNKLITRRKQKGITQAEIAAKMYMDMSNYCRRENGKKEISIKEWQRLAEILDVSLPEIYEIECSEKGSTAPTPEIVFRDNVYIIPAVVWEERQLLIENLLNENEILRNRLKSDG